jgi:hypothetical protein
MKNPSTNLLQNNLIRKDSSKGLIRRARTSGWRNDEQVWGLNLLEKMAEKKSVNKNPN